MLHFSVKIRLWSSGTWRKQGLREAQNDLSFPNKGPQRGLYQPTATVGEKAYDPGSINKWLRSLSTPPPSGNSKVPAAVFFF